MHLMEEDHDFEESQKEEAAVKVNQW